MKNDEPVDVLVLVRLRRTVTRAELPSTSSPIELSNVGLRTKRQLADGTGTPAIRASAAKATPAARDPVTRTMRRSLGGRGFRNGEHTSW